LGGGGNGGNNSYAVFFGGTINTGGGAGSGYPASPAPTYQGKNGGSGIVIVRYTKASVGG
jgi:hypothetical protein